MAEPVEAPAPGSADAVVIGAGAIGLAIAWRAALAGFSVVVLDPASVGGASRVAAGMLAPVSEAHFGESAVLSLGAASLERYPAFVRELEEASGRSAGLLSCGSLFVARDADDLAALDRELRFRQQLGLDVERLGARDCRALEPALAPGVRGGMRAPGDQQIDPRRLIAALREACNRCGVALVSAQAELLVDQRRVQAVRAGSTSISTDHVVLAAGVWSACIAGLPQDAILPIRPVKGQIVRLHGTQDSLPRHVIRGVEGYVVARPDGEVVCGATMEERGFDTSVTAGAVYEILRSSRELIPDVAEMELVEVSAGLRPATPDNAPCIGATPVQGLLAATGHHRNGILLTPVTANIIVSMLRGEAPPVDVTPFSPLRFESMREVVA